MNKKWLCNLIFNFQFLSTFSNLIENAYAYDIQDKYIHFISNIWFFTLVNIINIINK